MDIIKHPMVTTSRPFLRWWWFSGSLSEHGIVEQLDWIAQKGFGGVEIAWVYPLKNTKPDDGPRFLDEEWQRYVRFTLEECHRRNLGCDLTFGTLWPFGGTFIPLEYSSKTFVGYSDQRLTKSWESRYTTDPGLILDHLDSEAFAFYANHFLANGFRSFAEKIKLSFFCDSWEVEVDQLAHPGLLQDFSARFGYSLVDEIDELRENAAVRFDYRACLSQRILDHFYQPYARMCREAGALSRVQCHGAPTDILAAYALVDIPETETLLFDPDFALIAASAAAVADKPVVSSETFTCIYGWVTNTQVPPGIGEERLDDLRCVADAQFAWGVNRVVWHGKPYSSLEAPHRFYATVHLGPDGQLNAGLSEFNSYLAQTSGYLSKGKTYAKMAVYFPLEDQWMKDHLPAELEKPSSHFYWEFQELHLSDEFLPYRPLWFSGSWLKNLVFDGKSLRYGNQVFEIFVCDAEWMLFENLQRLHDLTLNGAPILWRQYPKEPGLIPHAEYTSLLEELQRWPTYDLNTVVPILRSEIPLDFWCRNDGDTYYLFISHPKMRKLRYPLPLDYHKKVTAMRMDVVFYTLRNSYTLQLEFKHARSKLYRIKEDTGFVEELTIPLI